MIVHAAGFMTVAVVLIVTPGPDTALTVRNTLLGGRRSGVCTAIGICTGQIAWGLLAAAGLAALLAASRPAFLVVKLLGGAYLISLGLRSLRAAAESNPPEQRACGGTLSGTSALRQGLFSNLGNPKMAVFFVGLLPEFASGHNTLPAMLLLGLAFSAMTLAWLSVYAAVVAHVGDRLLRGRARRLLDALAGASLVALGVRIATE